jgi:hypothetical protein
MELLLIRNEVFHRGYHSIIVILQPPYYIYIYCGFDRGAQWFVIMLSKSVPQCTKMGWNTAEER